MFPNGFTTDKDTPSSEQLAQRRDSIYSFVHCCVSTGVPQKVPYIWGKNLRSPSPEPQTDGKPPYDGFGLGPQGDR